MRKMAAKHECVLFVLGFLFGFLQAADVTPVVIWHGMGDCCCNPLSMGSMKKLIEENIPGVYVLSLRIGGNVVEDTENGFFMNVNDQITYACNILANDTNLKDGYHAVGFSQGGQFLRAVAQRCPNPKMKNLISVGGQHQGVYGLPHCPGTWSVCNIVRKLLNMGAYTSWIQKFLVQAEYWHDPLNDDEYKNKSIFLAEINNEKIKNPDYKTNLLKLDNLVLIKFSEDTMVVPKESEWFGFYKLGQSDEIIAVENSTLYTDDWIGLKILNSSNRLHFLQLDADHLQIDETWFIQNIINAYLKK